VKGMGWNFGCLEVPSLTMLFLLRCMSVYPLSASDIVRVDEGPECSQLVPKCYCSLGNPAI
jgi:hypothetical protein